MAARQNFPADNFAGLTLWQREVAQRRRQLLTRLQPLLDSSLSVEAAAARLKASSNAIGELLRTAKVRRGERITPSEKCRRLLAMPIEKLAPKRKRRTRCGRRKPIFKLDAFFREPITSQHHSLNHLCLLTAYLEKRLQGLSGFASANALGQSVATCWQAERRFRKRGLYGLVPKFNRSGSQTAAPRRARCQPKVRQIVMVEFQVNQGNGTVKLGRTLLRTMKGKRR